MKSIIDLPFEASKEIVQKLKDSGVESINYGTGECGLAKDFWRLVQYVYEQGILQGLTTNGWSINKDTIKIVKKCMNDVDVSVDFPNQNLHSSFRGHPDAWAYAMNALDLLKTNDVDCSIVTCIHAQNCNKKIINEFINLAQYYDCSWRINLFRPTGRGRINSDLKLNPYDVYTCFHYMFANLRIQALPDPYFSSMLELKNTECPCGERSFRITPNKMVVPCVYFTKQHQGLSIIDNTIHQIMDSEFFKTFRNRDPSFCNKCEYRKSCRGGCASRAYLEYGTLNAPDSLCHKVNNLQSNPFSDLIGKVSFIKKSTKVHENYLCTAIFTVNK
jgi:radical SAM protein with 4Fe4S-binding SPASM domain